jgi:hypothetical protein
MRVLLCVSLFLLCNCHEQRPPAPTSEQADQLNEAENMLNELGTNEEGPEQRPGPSNLSD